MRFWRTSRKPEAQPAGRELPPLDEAVWRSLHHASWRRGTGAFLGRHGAHFRAFAAQVAESRPYVPGDDPRFLDQRYQARSDRDVVKLARLEASAECFFMLDATSSMATGEKYSWACRAAWIGANLFNEFGDSYGVIACGEDGGLPVCGATRLTGIPAGRGAPHLAATRQILAGSIPAAGGRAFEDLRYAGSLLRGKTLGMLFSDFIAPRPALFAVLDALAESNADLVLVQILTREEREFPFSGTMRFVDPESGAAAILDAGAIAPRYRRHAAARTAELDRFAREHEYFFVSVDPARESPRALWQEILAGPEGTRPW
jgi:uncharacterized protein (DUF58 family)